MKVSRVCIRTWSWNIQKRQIKGQKHQWLLQNNQHACFLCCQMNNRSKISKSGQQILALAVSTQRKGEELQCNQLKLCCVCSLLPDVGYAMATLFTRQGFITSRPRNQQVRMYPHTQLTNSPALPVVILHPGASPSSPSSILRPLWHFLRSMTSLFHSLVFHLWMNYRRMRGRKHR